MISFDAALRTARVVARLGCAGAPFEDFVVLYGLVSRSRPLPAGLLPIARFMEVRRPW